MIGSQMKSKGAVCCGTEETNLFLAFGKNLCSYQEGSELHLAGSGKEKGEDL